METQTADEVQAPAPAPHGRAGRDLRLAVPVALGLIALVAASLFIRIEAFAILVGIACLMAEWELARAFRNAEIDVPLAPLWVGSIGMSVSAWVGGPVALAAALMLTAGTIFVWRALDGGGRGAMRDVAGGVFIAAYVPFLTGFAILMAHQPQGAIVVSTYILMVAGSDTGGYFAGVLLGKHPMAPSISPKKSWEGFAGSLVLASLVAYLMGSLLLGIPWWAAIGMGAITVVVATLGDLAESLLKRDLGVKDLGTLLPGHGGMMDRIDGMIYTAPVAWGLMSVLVPA